MEKQFYQAIRDKVREKGSFQAFADEVGKSYYWQLYRTWRWDTPPKLSVVERLLEVYPEWRSFFAVSIEHQQHIVEN